MQVKEIMTRGVETILPDAPLQEAAEKMRALDIGPLLVCDSNRLVGLITDRDLAVRATAEGRDPYSTTVREVMSEDVVFTFEDDDVGHAAQMMEDKQIRRLAVLDRNKRLVGIVSLGDLAVHTGDERTAGKTLEKVSEPS